MEDHDRIKSWLKNSLEEETNHICFSPEARERVKWTVLEDKLSLPGNWWNRQVSLPLKGLSISFLALIFILSFYTKTFFYVSEREMAKFEMREKIVFNDGVVPFGVVQQLALAWEKGVNHQ